MFEYDEIIWDEILMMTKHCLEAADRLSKDIHQNTLSFAGRPVVLSESCFISFKLYLQVQVIKSVGPVSSSQSSMPVSSHLQHPKTRDSNLCVKTQMLTKKH